jgi:hypothetical protein
MLTQAQSTAINSATITHDYEAEALASYNATGDDLMEELQARFENAIAWEECDDLGGLCVYYVAGELVAFYDYEQFRGSAVL